MRKGKPLLSNYDESRAFRILEAAAETCGAVVHMKPRLADVLHLADLSAEQRSYVLRAHFDFVVSEPQEPFFTLFAVEVDGGSHKEPDAIRKDTLKNELCRASEFSLARVSSLHLEKGGRGVDLLTWLAELYFATQEVNNWYKLGLVPEGEYFDATMLMAHERIPGRFPFAYALLNRAHIINMHKRGRLASPYPYVIRARDRTGRWHVLVLIQAGERYAVVEDSSYLYGFNALAEDTAEESAIDRLPISNGELKDWGWSDSTQLRVRLTTFLREHPNSWPHSQPDGYNFGFSVQFDCTRRIWTVGTHGRSPEFKVEDKR